jgi:hypothetical protein
VRLVLLIAVAGCSFQRGSQSNAQHDASESHDGRQLDSPVLANDSTLPIDAMKDASVMVDAPHTCPGYAAVSGTGTASTYRKVNTGTLWTTAKTACEADGAHLVIPGTNAEARAVYTFVNPNAGSPYYWAGIEDSNFDGVWTTVLGQTFNVTPWGPSQPSHNNGEIYMLVDSMGRFYDWYFNGAQEYACECEP